LRVGTMRLRMAKCVGRRFIWDGGCVCCVDWLRGLAGGVFEGGRERVWAGWLAFVAEKGL
jgi:hypothetical protein